METYALNSYIKKLKNLKMNCLDIHLKKWEKETKLIQEGVKRKDKNKVSNNKDNK